MSYISTHFEDATQNLTLATYHRKLALKVLLRRLKDPIGSLMRTKNPSDLNTALHMLTNDFILENTSNKNFKPKINYSNSSNFDVKRNISKLTNQPQLTNYLHNFANKNNFPSTHNQYN